MPKLLTPLLLLFLCAPAAAQSVASTPPDDPRASSRAAGGDAVRQLLYLPAPTPRTAQSEDESAARAGRPPGFHDKAPPDDAPDVDLADYWGRLAEAAARGGRKPSAAVRRRLLAICEAEPERLPRLLPLLPDAPDAAERVKKLFDAAQGSPAVDDDWRKAVREWLKFNSKYYLGELLALARKVRDKNGYVEHDEALAALAKVDPDTAGPVLEVVADGGQPRAAAGAVAQLYRVARDTKDAAGEEKYRARLKAVAEDRAAPGHARDTAIEALTLSDWAGRDEWYLSLFADETLLNLSDGSYGFSPLTSLFDRDPDRWIPVMAKLVESRDAAVRQNAASCLVQFVNGDDPTSKRRDAVLPVLRWLSDPGWLRISSTYRAWFMQHMDELDMPEAVPGLIWIVEHEEEHRHWAARTLAHYRDPRAVPALKKALAEEKDEQSRHYILQGLIPSGGLSEAEQLAALEAYAAKLDAPGGREEIERHRGYGDNPLPVPVSIGNYLARQKEAPDALARAVLARAEELRKTDPARARALLAVAEGWQARQIDLDMLRRVREGAADAETIANALERRERLRESVPAELRLLTGSAGTARGVAAVLLGDDALAQSVLASDDAPARLMLLACARLTQTPLPVDQVGALLRGRDADLALAAERYLLAEDSREARALVWARHPGEAFVTGWRENVQLIGGSDFSAMGRAEEKLRAELLAGGDSPQEIYALLGNAERPLHVLRIYGKQAVYTHYEDDARYRERAVTAEEVARFRESVATGGLPDSGPQIGYCHHDCWVSEFLVLRREGGRRVFSHQGFGAWVALLAGFDLLGREGSKVHYRLGEKINGLEVLFADDQLSVKDVWLRGDDLRVLVEREPTAEESRQEEDDEAGGSDEEDEDEAAAAGARAERRRRQLERARARLSWRSFAAGKLGAVAPQPEGYSTGAGAALDVDEEDFPPHLNSHLPQAAGAGFVVLAGDLGQGGLWKKVAGQRAVRLTRGEGVYADPLVSPDGRWAVAARAEGDWSKPNDVVRLDLRTGREYRVGLPPAAEFGPVAYVAAHGKFLLRRARDEGSAGESAGPPAPEYYLLDAATGATERVSGDFAPLTQEGRPLQPAGAPGEFWVAVPDREKNETRVGRYSAKDFTLRKLLSVPDIGFQSTSMWIDEAGAKLYFVYRGQLLRLPLPAAR